MYTYSLCYIYSQKKCDVQAKIQIKEIRLFHNDLDSPIIVHYLLSKIDFKINSSPFLSTIFSFGLRTKIGSWVRYPKEKIVDRKGEEWILVNFT